MSRDDGPPAYRASANPNPRCRRRSFLRGSSRIRTADDDRDAEFFPTSLPARSTPGRPADSWTVRTAQLARLSRRRRPTGQQSAARDGAPRFVRLARLQALAASHQHLGTPSCRLGRRNPRQTISSLSLCLSLQ